MANYSEQDIRLIVRSEIRKLFMNGFDATDADIEWLTTSQAVEKLNYPSADSLRKDIAKPGSDGNLRLGIEVQDRRKTSSAKPDYRFNYRKCVERLNTPPSMRSA